MSHRQENKETNGLGAIMLFAMPIAITVLLGVIMYLGIQVSTATS